MLDAVKQNGCTLCYASQALQNDCEIVDAPISNVYRSKNFNIVKIHSLLLL